MTLRQYCARWQFGRYHLRSTLARDRFDNEAATAAYERPILFVHGEADKMAPVRHRRRLADSAGANARLITYPGVDLDAPWDWRVFGRDLMEFYAASGVIGHHAQPG